MPEPWIRVHANLAQKRVVWRVCDVLKVSKHEAIGLLVSFWGGASQFASNGHVATIPDAQIEEWAGWRGSPGLFAAWVRAHHMDDEGRIREWEDYCGKLEELRERKRRQKADERARNRGQAAVVSPRQAGDVAAMSPHTKTMTKTSTKEAAASADLPTIDYLTRCVDALNTGMRGNPRVKHFREIATSTQAGVVSWETDGIPVDVAVKVITDRAGKYEPSGRNTQIKSLRYFENAVREEWDDIRDRVIAPDGSAKLVPGARSVTESAQLAALGYGVS